MLLLRLSIVLALSVMFFLPAASSAQWTTTLVMPAAKGIPIGSCAAIGLRIIDSKTGDTPRRPNGDRVTIADFDMAIASPGGGSFAGYWLDSYHWNACACQGATVGKAGSITATYPSTLLNKQRVTGVTASATGSINASTADGKYQPKVCANTAAGVKPLPPGETATAVATAAAAPLPQPAPTTTATPVTTTQPLSPAGTSAQPTLPPAPVTTTQPLSPAGTSLQPAPAPVSGPQTTGGPIAPAPAAPVPAPTALLKPPEGVTAVFSRRDAAGLDEVVLTWQTVPEASYYIVAGPPSNTAIRVEGGRYPQYVFTGVPPGTSTFRVAAMYLASPGVQQASAFVDVTVGQGNFYRLVAESIEVSSETVDQQESVDGKYDEIYVASIGQVFGRKSGIRQSSQERVSAVHGDVSFWPPAERVKAGSASANGGIRGGDKIAQIWSAPSTQSPVGAPGFVLWEGYLKTGIDDLVLHPTIWEADQKEYERARDLNFAICMYHFCSWVSAIRNMTYNPEVVRNLIAGNVIAQTESGTIWVGGNSYLRHLNLQHRDRPLGLRDYAAESPFDGVTGQFKDQVVVLSQEKIEAALAAGTNTISVRFWDHWNKPGVPPTTVSYLNGDYLLKIRIERMPAP